jgi:hypothetical protein
VGGGGTLFGGGGTGAAIALVSTNQNDPGSLLVGTGVNFPNLNLMGPRGSSATASTPTP